VHDLDKALALYEEMLHLKPVESGVSVAPELGMRMALLPLGDSYLELLQPTRGGFGNMKCLGAAQASSYCAAM
jgi:hypothetical protein